MIPLQKRRLKKKFQRFWKEWGITWEEFEMLLGAMSTIMFPFLLRIFLAFFFILRLTLWYVGSIIKV